MYGATLLFPNENMPYEVAATTWSNLIGCNEYKGAITLDAIRDFGKQTWGKGPRAGRRVPLHRPDAGRTDRSASAVGGEEAPGFAAG